MKKNILSLEGAKSLNKEEQKTINGGEQYFMCYCNPRMPIGLVTSVEECNRRCGGHVHVPL